MSLRHGVFLIALVGCGRLEFDPTTDAGAMPDSQVVAGRHWVNRNDGSPGRLVYARLAYHATRGTVILYGGIRNTTAFADASAAMWELTAAGWQLICDPCAPGPRFIHALGYDSVRDRLVLSGGRDNLNALFGGIWEWDGTTWFNTGQGGPLPLPREGAHFVFVPTSARLWLIGGRTTIGATAETHAWNGSIWTPIDVTGPPSPTACRGSCTTLDPASGRIVTLVGDMFGVPYDERWSTEGQTWTRDCTGCSGMPRSDASIVGDPARRALYLINGFDNPGMRELEGTWEQTPAGWSLISTLPPERDSSAVIYDAGRDTIVLYGGNGTPCGGNCGDTWEFVPD